MKYLTLLLASLLLLSACSTKKPQTVFNEGFIFGTVYHITYESPDGSDLHDQIKTELKRLDFSFSTYNKESVISKINRNESFETDSLFRVVFLRSVEISKASGGAFDPTVAPLVNAWGFGFKNAETISNTLIDSLRQFVGMDKIELKNDVIVKSDPRVMLDFSAIAKGYAVDVVGNLLHRLGCRNYMVEIGGEVVAKGVNQHKAVWRIGINEPNDDEPLSSANFQAIIQLPDKAVATSGNYRNFYEKDGKKYAHTIDPSTGYPVDHSLLSATVVAKDCMTADAWATAFMVLGIEKAYILANNLNELDAYFIFSDESGERKTMQTDHFDRYISK